MIFELAGVVGVDPGPWTLRELLWAAEGRERMEWERHSALMAVIVNVNRAKGPAAKATDFNPFYTRDSIEQKISVEEFGEHIMRMR